jgi:hypothetical protein
VNPKQRDKVKQGCDPAPVAQGLSVLLTKISRSHKFNIFPLPIEITSILFQPFQLFSCTMSLFSAPPRKASASSKFQTLHTVTSTTTMSSKTSLFAKPKPSIVVACADNVVPSLDENQDEDNDQMDEEVVPELPRSPVVGSRLPPSSPLSSQMEDATDASSPCTAAAFQAADAPASAAAAPAPQSVPLEHSDEEIVQAASPATPSSSCSSAAVCGTPHCELPTCSTPAASVASCPARTPFQLFSKEARVALEGGRTREAAIAAQLEKQWAKMGAHEQEPYHVMSALDAVRCSLCY